MNTHNLELKSYKYKELTTILEEQIKNGKSKQLQLKDWERYFIYKKGEKATFEIIEIYTEPLPKIDNRVNNGQSEASHGNNTEGIYGKYIDKILIDYFQTLREKYVIYVTNSVLAEVAGIINYNYRVANNKKNKFKQFIINKESKISNTAMYNVFNKTNEIKRKPIIASLERLQKQNLINYQLNYMIYFENSSRSANITESEIILQCEIEALEHMKITDKKKMMTNDKLKNEFYEIVNKLSSQEIECCDGIYQGFKIWIKQSIEDVEKIDNIEELKNELNEQIIRKVKDKMKIEKDIIPMWGIPNPNQPKWKKEILDCNYLAYTDIVIHYLLDIKSIRIVEAIESQIITYNTGESKDWDTFTKEEQNKMLNDATNVIDEEMEDILKDLNSIY